MLTSTFSTPLEEPAANAAVSAQTVWEFLASGGPVMVPIGLCSVLVLALTIERLLALRRARVYPAGIDDVIDAIHADRLDDARAKLGELDAPASRILGAGMRRTGFLLSDVETAIEDQAAKEVDRLERNIRPLALVAAIAPLLGLLGTVLGIAESFGRVSEAGMGKPEMLAGGIEEALTTTIAGLCVAIPAMLLAAYLRGRLRKLVHAMDEKIAPAVEPLAMRPESGGRDAA